MPFTITTGYTGPMTLVYKISIDTGKTFTARSLEEVAYGLQHYFRADLFDNHYDYQKHMDHAKECDCCPLYRGEDISVEDIEVEKAEGYQ